MLSNLLLNATAPPLSTFSILPVSSRLTISSGVFVHADSIVTELSPNKTVVADRDSHALLQVNSVDLNKVEHSQIIDLNDEGDRWEGDVLQQEPFGWGVLYDEDNNRRYEGFRIGSSNTCYGTQYYSDIQRVEYEGGWCDGKRWGRGTHYDRRGQVLYSGDWMDDRHAVKRVTITAVDHVLHNHIEQLTITDNCFNGEEWKCLSFSLLPNMRTIAIGNACFRNVRVVRIVGLAQLERMTVGRKSFTHATYGFNPDCCFQLCDCPKLRALRIGCKSFFNYPCCEIANVDALEVLEIGSLDQQYSFCFHFGASLQLKSETRSLHSRLDLPHLTTLIVGGKAFWGCGCVELESTCADLTVMSRFAGTGFHSTRTTCVPFSILCQWQSIGSMPEKYSSSRFIRE